MSYPTVSIIIPAYNAEKYLQETLESILAQDYPSIEVIVVDDGSTDNTSNIVKSYSHDSRVQYIYKSNSGSAKARNCGIANSTGEFLLFVDADDLLVPEAVSLLVKTFVEADGKYCLIYGEREHFDDETGKVLKVTDLSKTLHNLKQLFTFRTNLVLASLIHRNTIELVGGFNEKITHNEDHEMLLKLSKIGDFYGLGKVIYKYRIRSNSKTSLTSYRRAAEVTGGRYNYYQELLADEKPITKAWAWGYHYLMAGVEFREFDRQLSRIYFLISFLIYPLNLIPLKLLVASLRNRY